MLRSVILAAARSKRVERLVEKAPVSRDVVKRFVAGTTTDDALAAAQGLVADGLAVTLDFLGEDTFTTGQALATRDEYLRLLSALEARRSARSVTVLTADGSVGQRGSVAEHVDDLVRRSDADVVYAAGPYAVLRSAAAAAERAGAWSQVAVESPTPCGTGLCHGCPLPVVGEDGVERVVRACTEGPVIRGDRVRWDALGDVL